MGDLGAFFSSRSEEDQQKTQAAINNAPSERGNRRMEHPGTYVVKVGEFVWFDKKDPTHPIPTPSPEIKISRKNALLLNLSLQVCDKGTNLVPPGASIFHTVTLIPAKGADDKKIENTTRFMKPQMVAFTGKDKIEVNEAWLKENCTIDFTETAGKIEITRHHKMLKQVYATVDFVPDQNNKPKLKVIAINKLMPGDKSVTRKYTDEEMARMSTATSAAVAANAGNISPAEEADATEVKPAATMDTSGIKRTEEEF